MVRTAQNVSSSGYGFPRSAQEAARGARRRLPPGCKGQGPLPGLSLGRQRVIEAGSSPHHLRERPEGDAVTVASSPPNERRPVVGARNSSTRRDLPMPASERGSRAARASICCRRCSDASSRAGFFGLSPQAVPRASAPLLRTIDHDEAISLDPGLALEVQGLHFLHHDACTDEPVRGLPIRTSQGGPPVRRRAAMLTVSPVTSRCPLAGRQRQPPRCHAGRAPGELHRGVPITG